MTMPKKDPTTRKPIGGQKGNRNAAKPQAAVHAHVQALAKHIAKGYSPHTYYCQYPETAEYPKMTLTTIYSRISEDTPQAKEWRETLEFARAQGQMVWETLGMKAVMGNVKSFPQAAWLNVMTRRYRATYDPDKHAIEQDGRDDTQVVALGFEPPRGTAPLDNLNAKSGKKRRRMSLDNALAANGLPSEQDIVNAISPEQE